MTTTSRPPVVLDDTLIKRLTGAVGEFISTIRRPADVPLITGRLSKNMASAQESAAKNDGRSATSSLRAATSNQQFLLSEILVQQFMLKLEYSLQHDTSDPKPNAYDLMHALVAHVGALLRKISSYDMDTLFDDGTLQLNADWGDPRIERELYRLRRRLRDILRLPHTGD